MSHSRVLYLHIGAPKTGSTSVQAFLRRNAEVLAQNYDILYPREVREAPPRDLQAYAQHPDVDPRTLAALGPRLNDPEEFLRRYETRMRSRIRGMKRSRMVISSELLASLDDRGVERVRQLFGPEFDEVRVVYYIRRQDKMELSAYLQAFKGGYEGRASFAHPFIVRRPSYRSTIERWERTFGEGSMIVRVYERGRLPERDVVHDFLQVLGLAEAGADLKFVKEKNPTWGVRQLAAARILNPTFNRLPNRSDKKAPLRDPSLQRLIQQLVPGDRFLPSRAEAREFFDGFQQDNEWIRSRYFPSQPTLFDESFENYPEEGSSLSLSVEELEELMVEVWRHHMDEMEALEVRTGGVPTIERAIEKVLPPFGETKLGRLLRAARALLGRGGRG